MATGGKLEVRGRTLTVPDEPPEDEVEYVATVRSAPPLKAGLGAKSLKDRISSDAEHEEDDAPGSPLLPSWASKGVPPPRPQRVNKRDREAAARATTPAEEKGGEGEPPKRHCADPTGRLAEQAGRHQAAEQLEYQLAKDLEDTEEKCENLEAENAQLKGENVTLKGALEAARAELANAEQREKSLLASIKTTEKTLNLERQKVEELTSRLNGCEPSGGVISDLGEALAFARELTDHMEAIEAVVDTQGLPCLLPVVEAAPSKITKALGVFRYLQKRVKDLENDKNETEKRQTKINGGIVHLDGKQQLCCLPACFAEKASIRKSCLETVEIYKARYAKSEAYIQDLKEDIVKVDQKVKELTESAGKSDSHLASMFKNMFQTVNSLTEALSEQGHRAAKAAEEAEKASRAMAETSKKANDAASKVVFGIQEVQAALGQMGDKENAVLASAAASAAKS